MIRSFVHTIRRLRCFPWITIIILFVTVLIIPVVLLLSLPVPSRQTKPTDILPAVSRSHSVGQPCFILPESTGLLCHYRPGPQRPQCCCYAHDYTDLVTKTSLMTDIDRYAQSHNRSLRCLPSVMIIGAQKSGTTALMSFLAFHPNFAPPAVKEAHFFDRLPME